MLTCPLVPTGTVTSLVTVAPGTGFSTDVDRHEATACAAGQADTNVADTPVNPVAVRFSTTVLDRLALRLSEIRRAGKPVTAEDRTRLEGLRAEIDALLTR